MTQAAHQSLVSMPNELVGERVIVRSYRQADADAMFAAVEESRELLSPWFGWVERYRSVDDARDYCIRMAAQWLTRDTLSGGIFDAASGRYLGGAGLMRPNWSARSFEVGYWMRSSALGRGYTTEAVQLLTHLAFGQLAARRVEIRCDARNEPSRRVAERLGFVFEGRLRNHSLDLAGLSRDMLVFSLVPADYRQVGAAWRAKRHVVQGAQDHLPGCDRDSLGRTSLSHWPAR